MESIGTALRNGVQQTVLNLPEQPLTACVLGGSFSSMASLCSSSSVGHTVLLHIRRWQLQDMHLHC